MITITISDDEMRENQRPEQRAALMRLKIEQFNTQLRQQWPGKPATPKPGYEFLNSIPQL